MTCTRIILKMPFMNGISKLLLYLGKSLFILYDGVDVPDKSQLSAKGDQSGFKNDCNECNRVPGVSCSHLEGIQERILSCFTFPSLEL